ncbi:hypothetical protein Lal_00016718 [Lupinus albus]|nr:hypothetical protein Lal_00016718 [Lupinus albus]
MVVEGVSDFIKTIWYLQERRWANIVHVVTSSLICFSSESWKICSLLQKQAEKITKKIELRIFSSTNDLNYVSHHLNDNDANNSPRNSRNLHCNRNNDYNHNRNNDHNHNRNYK